MNRKRRAENSLRSGDWVEWGGELILAFGETAGGAPYGLTLEEVQRMDERDRRRAEARAAMVDFTHLRVKGADLAEALECHNLEMGWLLDLETGDVIMVTEDDWGDEKETEISFEDARYEPILPLESFLSFQIMEAFVEELPKGRPKSALNAALRHRKPFRSFKDALLAFPALREAWFRFHDEAMLRFAREWLAEKVPGAQLERMD